MRLVLVAMFTANAVLAQQTPSQQVFDDRTLSGWRGDPAIWRVENGAIVGSSVGRELRSNSFLVLDARAPADFEFVADVRFEGDNNGGVQYRSRELPGGDLGGYQCDLHPQPEYTAMLYDEHGAGIVAQHGQFVRWSDASKQVVGALASPRRRDLAQWHRLRIVAKGPLCWHEWDGRVVTAFVDERAQAPRAGALALQLHGGLPASLVVRDLALREFADAAAMDAAVPTPPAVRALLRVEAMAKAQKAAAGPATSWIWDDKPDADDELFFRREVTLSHAPDSAQLIVACDNHCKVYVNGDKVGESDAWERPLRLDVAKKLRAGANVVAVHGWNDGGPAGLAAQLTWRRGGADGGADGGVGSDASWSVGADDPDGWNTAVPAPAGFAPATVLGALGSDALPWSRTVDAGAFAAATRPDAPQVAVVDTRAQFTVGDAPITRLVDVPKAFGSWVGLGADPKGRIYAGAQEGGLYRVTPAAELGELSTIERVPVQLGGAHGMLWHRDALYAVVNGKDSGLYRLTDTDRDDVLDRVELLRKFEGEGEHGPHSVLRAPDGVHLLVVAGNHTKLPKLARSRVPTNWAEDRLQPRLDDPHKYWEGISPPGGWVCQCDADGVEFELVATGFRNPYDAVTLPTGEVVVYDADMEWDMGLPWYRPTRLLALVSGVDYGWRIGSAKWPTDYPEVLPPLLDLGPGSPTGMAVHDGPQPAVLALDWTFGTLYRDGRPWLVGAPFALTDAVVVGGATYVATGGRGLPSSLVRLPFGDAPGLAGAGPRELWGGRDEWAATETRTPQAILASVPARACGSSFAQRLPGVRARIALERLPVAGWRAAALAVDPKAPERSFAGLLALARQGEPADLQQLLDALGRFAFAELVRDEQIAWLRVHALALLRHGPADDAQRALVAARLLPLFPVGDERLDQELAELLAHVRAPGLLAKALPLLSTVQPSKAPAWAQIGKQADVYGAQYGGVIDAMAAAMPPIGQLAVADALRTVADGWTLAQRQTYFRFLGAARKQRGGSSYDGFLKRMIDAAWTTCSAEEQQALAAVVQEAKAEAPRFVAKAPKGPGRDWQPADIDAILAAGLQDADVRSGRNLFHATSCASCHYFAGEGGNHGPDLTSLGNKFSARDVLEAILEPSKVVSDQFGGQVVTKTDGTTLFGYAVKTFHGDDEVYEVMPATADAKLVRVKLGDVAKVERAPQSPMPADLVDRLSAAEVRDLLAFLLSRGQAAK
jgi:putative heme-binding domain-containing protein